MTIADASDAFTTAVAVATPGETTYLHIIEYTGNSDGLNPPIDCSYTACPDLADLSDAEMHFHPTYSNDLIPTKTTGVASALFADYSYAVFQEWSDTGNPATMLNRLEQYWDATITDRVGFDSALQGAEALAGVATVYPPSADPSMTHIVKYVIPPDESIGDPDVEVTDCSAVSCPELVTYYEANTMTLHPTVGPEYASQEYTERGTGWTIRFRPLVDWGGWGNQDSFLTRAALVTPSDISTTTLADAADAFTAAEAI